MFNLINLRNCPDLVVLKQEDEELSELLKLPADLLLLRWFNYHLTKAESQRTVNNFHNDVRVWKLNCFKGT